MYMMYIYIIYIWDHVLAKTKDTAERGWPDAQWLVSTSNDSSGATWGRKQKSTLELENMGFWKILEKESANPLGKLPVTTVTTLTLPARMLPKKNMLTLLEKSLYSTHVCRRALADLGGIEWHCMAVHLPVPACYNTSSNMF